MQSDLLPRRTTPISDEATVRMLYQQLMDGWNQGSGAAFAAVFAEDGDLIGFDGTQFEGRQAIAEFHQPLFATHLKGSRLVGEITKVRFLAEDVALMHAIGGTILAGAQAPTPERDSIQTLVAVRRDDTWQLAAFQNTRVRPMGRHLAGTLIWLCSDWLWKRFTPRRQVR
jgi:uncharacterized protein (TIGR02246 family)